MAPLRVRFLYPGSYLWEMLVTEEQERETVRGSGEELISECSASGEPYAVCPCGLGAKVVEKRRHDIALVGETAERLVLLRGDTQQAFGRERVSPPPSGPGTIRLGKREIKLSRKLFSLGELPDICSFQHFILVFSFSVS